jgi:hypothetical protein
MKWRYPNRCGGEIAIRLLPEAASGGCRLTEEASPGRLRYAPHNVGEEGSESHRTELGTVHLFVRVGLAGWFF